MVQGYRKGISSPRVFVSVLGLLGFVILFFSCSAGEGSPQTDIIRLGFSSPELRDLFMERALNRALLLPASPNSVRPGAISAWTMRADARAFSLALNKDARWSDGSEISLDHLESTLRESKAARNLVLRFEQYRGGVLHLELMQAQPDLIQHLADEKILFRHPEGLYSGYFRPADVGSMASKKTLLLPVQGAATHALELEAFANFEAATSAFRSGALDLLLVSPHEIAAADFPAPVQVLEFSSGERYHLAQGFEYSGDPSSDPWLMGEKLRKLLL